MKYIVKVYERPYEYTVEADSKAKAENLIINSHWAGDYSEILKVEVEKEGENND